jgi:hypothetical protein
MKPNMRDRPPIQTVGKGESTIVPINHRGAAVQNRARSQLDPHAYHRKLGGCFGTSRAVLRRVLASSDTPTGSKPPLKAAPATDNTGAVYFREFGTFAGDRSRVYATLCGPSAGCRLKDGNLDCDCALSSLSIETDRTERHRTSARRRISHAAMRLLRPSLRRAGAVQT